MQQQLKLLSKNARPQQTINNRKNAAASNNNYLVSKATTMKHW